MALGICLYTLNQYIFEASRSFYANYVSYPQNATQLVGLDYKNFYLINITLYVLSRCNCIMVALISKPPYELYMCVCAMDLQY
jgi:hypothetical protein